MDNTTFDQKADLQSPDQLEAKQCTNQDGGFASVGQYCEGK